MKLLSIGLSQVAENIRKKLENDCQTLTQEGFCVVIEELDRGGYTFLGLYISDRELSFRNYERIKNVLKISVSQTLADWIVSHEEHKLINKIVTNGYSYLSQEERATVESSVLRALSANPSARYQLILSRIQHYLDNHHELVLDGFLNFRLKDYRRQLSEVIDKVADDFVMEMECKEFIRVLRYFVDVQEPRVEEAHVVINSFGLFKIYDEHGKIINHQYLESDLSLSQHEDERGSIDHEDLLISALIAVAPYNIMVHTANRARDQETVETIKSIFDGRVLLCDGCQLCATQYAGKATHSEFHTHTEI